MIEAMINRVDDDGSVLPLAVVRITHEDGEEIARYSAQIAVDRGGEVGLYQRQIEGIPRKEVNVLTLLLAALAQLDLENLELVDDAGLSSDLEWGFAGAVREVQAKLGGLHHHRPALRSGQPEQHGGDGGG